MNKKKMSVLVIEDEAVLLRAIAAKLELSGVGVVSCTSGKQALDYLENLPELPDAIWLDYYLPDMNGLELMTRIKDNKKWSSIPVLVVSNSASSQKVQNMLALGADKYILKAEHRLDDIIKIIGALVEDSRSK